MIEDSEILKKYFSIDRIQYIKLKKLGEYIYLYNKSINLVSRNDVIYIYTRHILHSLIITKFVKFNKFSNILDIGTGAGFPGLPLAILFSDCNFILVDSVKKKLDIVNKIISFLNIDNVKTYHLRIGENTQIEKNKLINKFDYIMGRGVTNMNNFYNMAKPLLKKKSLVSNSGIWYLRGDDIDEKKFKNIDIYHINKYIPIEFYQNKKIVHLF